MSCAIILPLFDFNKTQKKFGKKIKGKILKQNPWEKSENSSIKSFHNQSNFLGSLNTTLVKDETFLKILKENDSSNQSSFSQEMPILPTSIHSSFEQNKDNQPSQGIVENTIKLIKKNKINCNSLLTKVESEVKLKLDKYIKEIQVNNKQQ